MGSVRRRRHVRPPVVGAVVALVVLAVLYAPALVSDPRGAPSVGDPVLPRVVAPYSWLTGRLTADRMDAAALLYQNGFGVEFLDQPQAVLLGADGSTHRRLGAAEARTVEEDQGDPATSVLSADGTFVVIGSAAPTGAVEVVTLRDGHRRSVPTRAGQATLPLAIGADGRTVLLATSAQTVNRYAGESDLGLARLDLRTGAVHDYPAIRHVEAAALSPDGSRIAVVEQGAIRVLDAVTGTVRTSFHSPRSVVLDGDAWSPDGHRLALVAETRTVGSGSDEVRVAGSDLLVVDVSGATPVERRLPLGAVTYGGTAIGWRDDETVLVHGQTGGDDNTSALLWVDATTGVQTSFATYRPDAVTGAAMGRVDAARDLASTWQVADRPVDRGPWPLTLGLAAAALAGLLAMAVVGVLPLVRRARSRSAARREVLRRELGLG